jgi:hypothetical protein
MHINWSVYAVCLGTVRIADEGVIAYTFTTDGHTYMHNIHPKTCISIQIIKSFLISMTQISSHMEFK